MKNTAEYCLGIDVGKYEHQATLINKQKQVVGESIRFANNQESFQEMIGQIKKSLPREARIKVGMESTGHYWINLNNFLKRSGLENIQVINPIETQEIAKTRIRKVKNDRIDSLEIAKIASEREAMPGVDNAKMNKLKRLTRFYDKTKRQSKFYKREIINLLELICPEYEGLFSNIFSKTSLLILKAYADSEDFSEILENKQKKEEFIESLRKTSRGRCGKGKAQLVLKTIGNSIGKVNRDYFSCLQLKMLLESLEMIEKQIAELEKQITKLGNQFEENKFVNSVVGVSEISAAVYLAELGDILRFSSKHQLTAFAGLDASVKESGSYKRREGNRISKRGSRYLRKQLYYAAKTAVIFDPELKAFYERKKKEGKHYNVIMIAVARKILFRIYAVLKEKRFYEAKTS